MNYLTKKYFITIGYSAKHALYLSSFLLAILLHEPLRDDALT